MQSHSEMYLLLVFPRFGFKYSYSAIFWKYRNIIFTAKYSYVPYFLLCSSGDTVIHCSESELRGVVCTVLQSLAMSGAVECDFSSGVSSRITEITKTGDTQ